MAGLAGAAAAECPVFAPLSEPGEQIFYDSPPILVLGLIGLARNGDAQEIWRYPDLPDGGIAQQHICGPVQVIPFSDGHSWASEPPEDATAHHNMAMLGLALRDGVDYASAYPNAHPVILERQQYFNHPGGRFWAGQFAEDTVPAIDSDDLNALIAEHSTCAENRLLIVEEAILIPTC
ncbi:MAG: hypothetical protein AAGA70_11820 [Pseudomonadota bacterium]